MSDHTHVIERVAGRNPVPNLDDPPIGAWDLDVVRSAVTERDIPMTTTDERPTQKTTPIKGRRGGWQVAVASFAIVLLAAGGLWFATRAEVANQPPTTNAPTNDNERIALEALAALYAFDEEAFVALASTGSVEGSLWGLRHEQGLNTTVTSITCTQSQTATTVANCQLTGVDSDVIRVLGIEPQISEFDVTVIDGGWAFMAYQGVSDGPQILMDWDSDLRDRHPGIFREGVCENNKEGGPTPVECAVFLVDDAKAWMAANR